MENIGIDVHRSESQICIITPTGEVFERRVGTRRERFAEVVRHLRTVPSVGPVTAVALTRVARSGLRAKQDRK